MLLQATPSPAAQGKHIRHKAAYIATQPASQTVTEGQTATFFAGVTGTTPLLYQWKQNGATIAGATSSSYTTPATTRSISGTQFTLTVSNSYGSATSNPAVLTVNAAVAAPIISAEPANLTVTASQSAIFSVAATGTSPFSYQWMRNGAAISGANSATYDIASPFLLRRRAPRLLLINGIKMAWLSLGRHTPRTRPHPPPRPTMGPSLTYQYPTASIQRSAILRL